MATNITNSQLLPTYWDVTTVETIPVAPGTVTAPLPAFKALTGSGTPPSAIGQYVAGFTTRDLVTTELSAAVATAGYAIAQVATGATIVVDSPIATDISGNAIVATGTQYIVGYSMDNSTGSVSGKPHYIRVRLSR